MTVRWNNKGGITFRIVFIIFCFMLYAICYLLYPDNAKSGPPYLNSAHGNTPDGVNRSSLSTFGYSIGNCAHCHEQHASIGRDEPAPDDNAPSKYALFNPLFSDQANSFCFLCHIDLLTTIQVSMLPQYNYSHMAGNHDNSCPNSISQAFQFVDTSGNPTLNCGSSKGSSHFLYDIRSFLSKQSWGFGSNVENINPCSGCHNPHMAQRDPHTTASRGWTVSRPSQHSTDNNLWGLWGDTEKMSDYTGLYQAPCRYEFKNPCLSFEPDGSLTQNGSNLFDTVSFCLDCHSQEISGSTGGVSAIDWTADGDIHGGAPPQTCCDKGDKRHPYLNTGVNYVLSCLDCHEPHGSPNEYLLRQEVNGNPVPIPNFDPYLYYNFCRACHRDLNTKHTGHIPDPEVDTNCRGCHQHGKKDYPAPLGCESCPGTNVKTF